MTGRAEARGWEWVEPWLRLKYRKQHKTRANSLNWWSWLFAFLEERGIAGPRALDRTGAMDYIEWRMGQVKRSGKKPGYNSALQELKMLGRVMREAIHRGLATSNPCERLGLEKEKAPEKPEMTDAEIAQIRSKLAGIEGHLPLTERWMSVSFEIALHQGCREQETQIPIDRIDWAAGTIRFHAKRAEVYTVPIHPGLRPLLEQLRGAGARTTCTLPPMASRHWTRFFKGRAERSEPAFLGHLCFHCSRVTVVTRLARAGVPLQQAMAYVHHANELIHRVYQRLRPADVTGCHAALAFPESATGSDGGLAGRSDAGQAIP